MLEVATANMTFHQSTKQKGNNDNAEKKSRVKFLENGSYFSHSAFVGEKRFIKNNFFNYCNIFG